MSQLTNKSVMTSKFERKLRKAWKRLSEERRKNRMKAGIEDEDELYDSEEEEVKRKGIAT